MLIFALLSYCLCFDISLKLTRTGIEKSSKTINLPAAFPHIILDHKSETVSFTANTEDTLKQLVIAFESIQGHSKTFLLNKQVSLDISTLPAGSYSAVVYCANDEKKERFIVGSVDVVGAKNRSSIVQPEINHVFRPVESQGSVFLGLLFSALTICPVFVLWAMVIYS